MRIQNPGPTGRSRITTSNASRMASAGATWFQRESGVCSCDRKRLHATGVAPCIRANANIIPKPHHIVPCVRRAIVHALRIRKVRLPPRGSAHRASDRIQAIQHSAASATNKAGTHSHGCVETPWCDPARKKVRPSVTADGRIAASVRARLAQPARCAHDSAAVNSSGNRARCIWVISIFAGWNDVVYQPNCIATVPRAARNVR
jgi:hypothetical protein